MSEVPSLGYERIVRALQRDGWVVVRQRGSHLRLQKHLRQELLKLTVPTHRPVLHYTLAHILKQARLSVEQFVELLWRGQTRGCREVMTPRERVFACTHKPLRPKNAASK
jgi:predicted RNA binding protein YcfA (HicA-like mRNA interferase family)